MPSRPASPSPSNGSRPNSDSEDQDNFDSVSLRYGVGEAEPSIYFLQGDRVYNNTSWAYRMPADDAETQVIAWQNTISHQLSESLPGLFRGPVSETILMAGTTCRILDIGCGSGIWLHEMAERYPQTDCVGIDLVPASHDHHLSNWQYMFMEVPTGTKVLPDGSFNIIHIRQMLHAVPDYKALLLEAFRLLRPSGLLLIHEPRIHLLSAWEEYDALDLAPGVARYYSLLSSALAYRGVNMDTFDRVNNFLTEVGFGEEYIDYYQHYRAPCVNDPSLGTSNEADHTLGYMRATRLILMEARVIDDDEFDKLLTQVAEELAGRSKGEAGPDAAKAILSEWGYWWAMKT
ncbi:hypothetical protein M231_03376 [Tremella mesenterica]|uniref:Methyltransferase domain-containing protein n=1 Tax=Tremella mesenterica TaxID=5217 RepID=A0A4V1M466_TREME|nr:hypothetical protein M231_03376 [Tremella mesenterica]